MLESGEKQVLRGCRAGAEKAERERKENERKEKEGTWKKEKPEPGGLSQYSFENLLEENLPAKNLAKPSST